MGAMTREAQADAPARDRSALQTSVLIGICCLLIYNANGRGISAGDTYPARYLPFAILQHRTILLNPVAEVTAQGRGAGAFWMLHRPDGRIFSLYPVVVPLLVTPLYVPAVGYLWLAGATEARLDFVARWMEKLSASILASLSVSLLYLLLRRRASASIALLLTIAFAFGTTMWVISSQALWQHGLGALLVIGALLFLTGPCTLPRAAAAGLLCGLIAANRPPDAILAAALGVYGLYWARKRASAAFIAAAGLPLAALSIYNVSLAGHFLGGYGLMGRPSFFHGAVLPGVAGLLLSPTHGLFVFSPFLLFLGAAWRYLPRDRDGRLLTWAMVAAIALQLVMYGKADWRAGLSWGPRYLTDLLPFLIWLLVPVVSALRGAARIAFVIAVVLSIAIEAIGAFMYVDRLDTPIYAADRGAERDMRGAWQWRNSPILTSLRNGVMPSNLSPQVRGSFDALEAGGLPASVVTAGEKVVAAGWALAGDATPLQVGIAVDGAMVTSRIFFDRPDVREALRNSSPAGWRISIDTAGLTPGEHSLTAFAWSSEMGEPRYLQGKKLTVRAAPSNDAVIAARSRHGNDSLEERARIAASRIREHQQAPGYWLTSFTSGTRFHDPRVEMNTFLTSFLVDLLDPLAGSGGFESTLDRARAHLTAQIERGGLVRYHGLPDGPGIGTLGCVITPDTDDTALVWRLAPAADRSQLSTALTTIDRYRTPEGLYRSWLASRDDYRCLDPGRDPNPADIAIQMHLLLLLSEADPPASRALCQALRPLVDEDRIWVYYRMAPLVPILRLPDLQRAGCRLELPDSRMRTDVPDQQIWISVVRMLTEAERENTTRAASQAQSLLDEIARDDFALVRTNPPLLYHNDLTATVPRYYWSEDAGYALWLRLHDRYERRNDPVRR